MIKTDRYVQTEAAGMLYRLIPVTEEIIRCVIGKEEIKENDSLIIEKKGRAQKRHGIWPCHQGRLPVPPH